MLNTNIEQSQDPSGFRRILTFLDDVNPDIMTDVRLRSFTQKEYDPASVPRYVVAVEKAKPNDVRHNKSFSFVDVHQSYREDSVAIKLIEQGTGNTHSAAVAPFYTAVPIIVKMCNSADCLNSLSAILIHAKSDADISNALYSAFMFGDAIPNGDHLEWKNSKKIEGVIQGAFNDADGFQWIVIEAEKRVAGIAISPQDSQKFELKRGLGIRLSQDVNYRFMVKEVFAVQNSSPSETIPQDKKQAVPKP